MKLARCRAVLDGRDYVTPEDVKAVAVPALSHRLTLRPELWVQRVRPEDIVAERLETVPTPRAEDVSPTRS
jgi:MoxR-like ATPase